MAPGLLLQKVWKKHRPKFFGYERKVLPAAGVFNAPALVPH